MEGPILSGPPKLRDRTLFWHAVLFGLSLLEFNSARNHISMLLLPWSWICLRQLLLRPRISLKAFWVGRRYRVLGLGLIVLDEQSDEAESKFSSIEYGVETQGPNKAPSSGSVQQRFRVL